MSQVGEAGAGGTGAGILFRREKDATRPDVTRRHPASLEFAPPVAHAVPEHPGVPSLVRAGLILLTAAAVLEGYRWLNVIPSSRLHPSAPVFAVLMVPCCLFLARAPREQKRRPAQKATVAGVVGLVAVTAVELVVDRPWSAHLLGAYDLALAATLLGAALVGGECIGG